MKIFIKDSDLKAGGSGFVDVEISTSNLISELERRRPCKRCKDGDCNGCLWQMSTPHNFKVSNFKDITK